MTQSGTVVGTVSDQAGAVVPGAKITLVHEGTQFTRTATTNASGQYAAYSFPTGRLTITVEHPGFQKLVRSGVELTAADTLTVDLRLSIGNVAETIEVKGEAPLLQSQTAAVSTLIDNQRILQTPLNGRHVHPVAPAQRGRHRRPTRSAGERQLWHAVRTPTITAT